MKKVNDTKVVKSERFEFRMYKEAKAEMTARANKLGCSLAEFINRLIEQELNQTSA